MRTASLILILASATLLVACGHEKRGRWNPNGNPPRSENFHGGANAMLLHYDANHDGTLTRAELDAGLEAEFNALDVDHDGCLNKAQVDAINQKRIATDEAAASPLVDWNGDGCVDLNEFSLTARSLFDSLDKNNDGKITPQEFNPHRKGAGGASGDATQQGQGGGHHHRGGGEGGGGGNGGGGD